VDAAQLFRNLTIPGEGALHFLIVVDAIGKEGFGYVEVDSQTNGNNAGKKEYLSEEVQQPVLAKSSADHDQHCQHNHEAEQHFGEVIQLLISLPHLYARVVGVHHAAHLPACVHHDGDGLTVGQEAVAPQSIVQVESFPHAVVLRAGLDLEDPLKVVDVQFGRLRLDSG
jgi:hypothetical protein